MRIRQNNYDTVEELEDNDYQDVLEIYINGLRVFSVHDGEPEDNTLSRNFSDCFSIVEMMKVAFDAGARGESWEVE